MSKSTPINQLPSQMGPQNTFVNDQQRQMITQAQQAIGNSQMPQNTTLPNDILNEDDSVIQDMLNNLNANQQQQQDLQHQEEFLRMAALNHMNINQVMQQPQQQYMPPPSQQYFMPPMTPAAAPTQQLNMQQKFMSLMTSEFKLAGLVFAVVIIVQFVPFHRYLSKYIAIEKIPYHDIILRGILAALAVIIAKKLIM